MKDIPIIITILIFWFLLVSITSYIASDNSLNDGNTGNLNNNTLHYNTIDTTNFNVSSSDPNTSTTTGVSFINMLVKIFTFRLPTIAGIPAGIGNVISFLNYLLLLVMGLLVYRLIRNGGG